MISTINLRTTWTRRCKPSRAPKVMVPSASGLTTNPERSRVRKEATLI